MSDKWQKQEDYLAADTRKNIAIVADSSIKYC